MAAPPKSGSSPFFFSDGEDGDLLRTSLDDTDFAELQLERQRKLERLRNLEPFILDNSIREPTVASIMGQSLADKWDIIRMIKMSGVRHVILGSFSTLKRVDDQFVMDMKEKGVICPFGYAFSEISDGVHGGVPLPDLPLGLSKCKNYGVQNAILELDVASRAIDWGEGFGLARFCELVKSRCAWVKEHLSLPSRPWPAASFINMRDFPQAIQEVPERLMEFVGFIARLPASIRPAGLLFEDPGGEYLPSEMGPWVAMVRRCMEDCGWHDGKFLLHVHHNYGLAQAVVLECLASGADGVWAAVCDEGAATGHAGYLVTLANLARLGNPHVTRLFNMPKLVEAARRITAIMGAEPPLRQEVYGARAMSAEFGRPEGAANFEGVMPIIVAQGWEAKADAARAAVQQLVSAQVEAQQSHL